MIEKLTLTTVPLLLMGGLFGSIAAGAHLEVGTPVAESRFGPEAPPDWQLEGTWDLSPDGATAGPGSRARSSQDLPESCLIEMIFNLPAAERLEEKVTASLSVGSSDDEAQRLTVSAEYQNIVGEKPSCPYKISLSGTDNDGKPVSVNINGDMRPTILRGGSGGDHNRTSSTDEEQGAHGWAGRTVSLGMTLDEGLCRLLVNGNALREIAVPLPSERILSVAGEGITLRAVRVLPGIPSQYVFLGGGGLALHNGGASEEPTESIALRPGESGVVEIDGTPFVVQGAGEGRLAALDVAAENWAKATWSEGKGMPMVSLPHRWYGRASLLLHHVSQDGKTPAMGFGLRVPDMSGGDLKNIYVGSVPTRCSDAGVTMRPVPELGEGWLLVRVPINPAALIRLGSAAYFTRQWTAGGGHPAPYGDPSTLRVAACTVEEAGLALSVEGNGLGNIYDELAQPRLTGVLRNRTPHAVTVKVTTELLPFEREPSKRSLQLRLAPDQEKTFDALASPVTERGHFRVRIVADGGPAGRIDYRTNVGVLAPDTRMRLNSPFGCWHRLWDDRSTEQQSNYLKVKAGVDFWMNHNNQGIRVRDPEIPDDAKAAEVAKSIGPEVTVFTLGWEQNWGLEHTFAFPRVIAEGQPEELSDEMKAKADQTAEDWRRLARAIRQYRPHVKISLGNSAVNFSVPFLERGFKPGVEFDYFGTEEGIFSTSPEQPNTAIGNTNWWTKAICEHFGLGKVPLFHSESVYFSTGPAFSTLTERTQAGHYVRTYLLGLPYDSVFGMAGALVDSSNRYIYSNWGASGYCNQAPECSPKLSYVAFATLTQLLDSVKYEGRLDAGSTSLYALHFSRPGNPRYVLWNLRGRRTVTLAVKDPSKLEVIDAINRPVDWAPEGDQVSLVLSDLPTYIAGTEITEIQPGANIAPSPPPHTLLSPLENIADWVVDTEPDEAFEAPGEWTGVPRVRGPFEVTYQEGVAPVNQGQGSMAFTLKPLENPHGLIPRYVSLTARPGQEVPIPKGTTRLGVWIRGNSTWGAIKFGVINDQGARRVLLDDRTFSFGRMMDNFDGWRFLDTGPLNAPDIQAGECKIDRIVVVMPQQQVYVDELLTTPQPEIAIWGLSALSTPLPDVSYLPW